MLSGEAPSFPVAHPWNALRCQTQEQVLGQGVQAGWEPCSAVTSAGEPRCDPCVPTLLDVMGLAAAMGLVGRGALLPGRAGRKTTGTGQIQQGQESELNSWVCTASGA